MKLTDFFPLLTLTALAASPLNAAQPKTLADIPDPAADAEKAGFVIPEGFEMNLFASEPMLHKPVQMNWDAQGRLLLRSDSAPATPLAARASGYSDVVIDGAAWRTFTLRSPEGRWFQSAELSDIRDELAEDIAEGTLLPFLLSLPLPPWPHCPWAPPRPNRPPTCSTPHTPL